MKPFLKKIIFFTLGLLLLNFVFSTLLYPLYYQEYEKIDPQFETYLLADSHGSPLETHLEEYNLYNFSAPSDSYQDMLRKFKYLLGNTEVKTVLISVDDHTLSLYRNSVNNQDRSTTFTTSKDYQSNYEFFKSAIAPRHISLLNPKARDVLYTYFKSIIFRRDYPDQKIDWTSKNWLDLDLEKRSFYAKNRFEVQFLNFETSESLLVDFKEIIKLAKQNNVNLIGIKFPVSTEFNELIGNKSLNAHLILEENQFTILDFKSIFDENQNLFYNQDHLNAEGGIKLSQYIQRELKALSVK